MNIQKKVLSIAVVCASAGFAAGSASAGEVHPAGLDAASHHQQFIVKYAPGSAAIQDHAELSASLQRAAGSLRTARAAPPSMQLMRRMAVGPVVVRSDRPLDTAEAARWMRTIAADPQVDYVEVDRILTASLDPDDPRLGEQWGFSNSAASINVRPAWDRTTGEGQVVAVIDTGITAHPELDANTLPGYDFISNPSIARDGDGRDDDPSDPGDGPWGGSSWHGTHVSGTVAALTDNAEGVAGTATGARLLPVRVLGAGGGTLSDIADAMVWAAGGSVPGVPANPHPAAVLNLSLGGGGACGATMQAAVDSAMAQGATVVVAAGNNNGNVARFTPASCNGVVAVAATTSGGARAGFSNYGSGITISAPGAGILSTLNNGSSSPGAPSYAVYSGTSMAAPHVAGVVALMQSAAGGRLDPGQVADILRQTARPLLVSCPQGCGAGIVNADAAVEIALEMAASGQR